MNPTIALIQSAFGPGKTLYDVLQSSKAASQVDLKRAYHKMALKYHPDKQVHCLPNSNGTLLKDSTIKFQAVSAAYEVLMDTRRRSEYDATGRVAENDELNCEDAGNSCSSHASNSHTKKQSYKGRTATDMSDEQRQRHWNDFFHSIFSDIMGAKSRHGDADSYRASTKETEDVLKYYVTCKGNFQRILKCVIHGTEKDIDRWIKDIIMPAIVKGDIKDYRGIMETENNNALRVQSSTRSLEKNELVDSDEDNDTYRSASRKKKSHKIGRMKKRRLKRNNERYTENSKNSRERDAIKTTGIFLEDSDDDSGDNLIESSGTTAPTLMNRRDKMEYRVAKKRKLKAKREIEISEIMNSKSWTSSDSTNIPLGRWNQQTRSGMFNDALLSNIAKKYSKGASNGATRYKR